MSDTQAIPALPPVIVAFIAGIKPSFNVLTVCSVWLGVSIPLFFILFYSSSAESRRKPLFFFNAVSILIGITMGFMNIVILIRTLIDPINGLPRPAMLFYTAMTIFIDIIIDSILLFRVVAVFPPGRTSFATSFVIFGPLILLKIGRIANAIVFIIQFTEKTKTARSLALLNMVAPTLVGPKIGWALQMVDNMSCSGIFLWKLNQARSLSIRIRTDDGGARNSYSAQLRALFWIAVSNFVFPVFFDIALYILIFRDAADYSAYLIVLITNIYVEIIGVLFATVWAATKHSESPGPTIANAETLQFARNMALESGTLDSGVGVNDVRTDDSIGFDKGEKKQRVLGVAI